MTFLSTPYLDRKWRAVGVRLQAEEEDPFTNTINKTPCTLVLLPPIQIAAYGSHHVSLKNYDIRLRPTSYR